MGADVTDAQFRTLGLVEVLGAIELILPAALGVGPILMPLAALGLALTMVSVIVIVVVVLALAALVYELLGRGNPRQDEVDAEREQVAEQIGLREPIDFESDLRPPREP